MFQFSVIAVIGFHRAVDVSLESVLDWYPLEWYDWSEFNIAADSREVLETSVEYLHGRSK